VSGEEVEIVGERCNEQGMRELLFSDPSGPTFHYNPPTMSSFGDQPLICKFKNLVKFE
jgi:hypothetical protein